MHPPVNYVFFYIDQCHEEAHEDENSDDDSEEQISSSSSSSSSHSQVTKRNHEAVFQETKPRITRRHSYGKYGSEPDELEVSDPNYDNRHIFLKHSH